jgi:adenine-specific DNA-methyltransferase
VIERIVLSTSNKGDLAVDPFLGTGTTASVALQLGRRFAGCDISKTCVAESRRRIAHLLT